MSGEAQEKRELPELAGYMTISAAAARLNVARQSAHRMVELGQLAAWRVPSAGADRPLVVKEADVDELVKKRQARQVVEVPESG